MVTEDKSDLGISTIEALIAVALVSISLIALASGSFSAIKAANKSRHAAISMHEILVADSIFRDFVGNVRIPYWDQKSKISIEPKKLELPWLNGARDSYLILSADNDSVIISNRINDAETKIKTIKSCKDASFSAIESSNGRVIGITLTVEFDSREFTITAPFGSTPLIGDSL